MPFIHRLTNSGCLTPTRNGGDFRCLAVGLFVSDAE